MPNKFDKLFNSKPYPVGDEIAYDEVINQPDVGLDRPLPANLINMAGYSEDPDLRAQEYLQAIGGGYIGEGRPVSELYPEEEEIEQQGLQPIFTSPPRTPPVDVDTQNVGAKRLKARLSSRENERQALRAAEEERTATSLLMERLRQGESDREQIGRAVRAAADIWGGGKGFFSKLKGPEERELDRLKQAAKIELDMSKIVAKRAGGDKRQVVTLQENGKSVAYNYNLNTGEMTRIGEKGYAYGVVKDPISGQNVLRSDLPGIYKGRSLSPGENEIATNFSYDVLNPSDRKYIDNLSKEYRSISKPIDDFEGTVNGLDSFVKANLDGTKGSIQRQLARTVGQEKGVMTDRDVAAFGGTEKVITAIAQYAHAKVHGGMTPEIQKNYENILRIASGNIARKRLMIERKYILPANLRLSKYHPNQDQVRQVLGFDYQQAISQPQIPNLPTTFRGKTIRQKSTGKTFKWDGNKYSEK